MDTKVTICDSIMGSGKTSAAFDYVVKSKMKKRFIFITPYLEEVERTIKACNLDEQWVDGEYWGSLPPKIKEQICFVQPSDEKGSKLVDLKRLLKNGKNIVATHALFSSFDSEVISLIEEAEYMLIMDETPSVIELYNNKFANKMTTDDINLLLHTHTIISEENNHFLKWNNKGYIGRFNDIKKLCELNSLGIYGENENGKKELIWLQPIKSFTCFEEVFILTYMFDGQLLKYYFDINGIEYNYCIAIKSDDDKYNFKMVDELPEVNIDKNLINIYQGVLNEIGNEEYTFSVSWYKHSIENGMIETVKKSLYNYIRNIVKAKAKDIMWTCFKDNFKHLKHKGYAKNSFLEHNARATNDYQNRSTVCYMVNIFLNPIILGFFKNYSIRVDEEKYALSSLLQFLWRSCLRVDKPINLFIPSKRMRDLLLQWLGIGTAQNTTTNNKESTFWKMIDIYY